jgi:hypothetical protein
MVQTIKKTRKKLTDGPEKPSRGTRQTLLRERQDKSRRGTGQNPTERQDRLDREKGQTWQGDRANVAESQGKPGEKQGERPKLLSKSKKKQSWQRYSIVRTIKIIQTTKTWRTKKKNREKTDRWTGKT